MISRVDQGGHSANMLAERTLVITQKMGLLRWYEFGSEVLLRLCLGDLQFGCADSSHRILLLK
jgi:hypothetical protein